MTIYDPDEINDNESLTLNEAENFIGKEDLQVYPFISCGFKLMHSKYSKATLKWFNTNDKQSMQETRMPNL